MDIITRYFPHIAGHHHAAQLRLTLNMLFIHFLWADFSPVLVEMAQMWLSQRNYKQRRGAEPSCFERVMTWARHAAFSVGWVQWSKGRVYTEYKNIRLYLTCYVTVQASLTSLLTAKYPQLLRCDIKVTFDRPSLSQPRAALIVSERLPEALNTMEVSSSWITNNIFILTPTKTCLLLVTEIHDV